MDTIELPTIIRWNEYPHLKWTIVLLDATTYEGVTVARVMSTTDGAPTTVTLTDPNWGAPCIEIPWSSIRCVSPTPTW